MPDNLPDNCSSNPTLVPPFSRLLTLQTLNSHHTRSFQNPVCWQLPNLQSGFPGVRRPLQTLPPGTPPYQLNRAWCHLQAHSPPHPNSGSHQLHSPTCSHALAHVFVTSCQMASKPAATMPKTQKISTSQKENLTEVGLLDWGKQNCGQASFTQDTAPAVAAYDIGTGHQNGRQGGNRSA